MFSDPVAGFPEDMNNNESLGQGAARALCSDGQTKPTVQVDGRNPDQTVTQLRDVLAAAGCLYDRGVPVRLVFDQAQNATVAESIGPPSLVMLAHQVCRPMALKRTRDGDMVETEARLPDNLAYMYLQWRGEWHLPPLNGIASAPLLADDGSVVTQEGYDRSSGMWLENVPDLAGLLPDRPTWEQVVKALLLLRGTFSTFCFADAATVEIGPDRGKVDLSRPPGRDESAFLVALLTAVCRPSVPLAPGVLISAAALSGAGAGKGLLARCISIIAFGREPHAVTSGGSMDELEKRIASELMAGGPVLFLDNLNNTAFRSDLLASAITERPARVRVLGRSQMASLNASAFVVLTGNALSVSEDLARRFVGIALDPRTEHPETRSFPNDVRIEVTRRRPELLAALLTIWRWGRQTSRLPAGRPLGSFHQWGRWVRDPLLALGCCDPVQRITETKQKDTRRQSIVELFEVWSERHADRPMPARDLHPDVTALIDQQGRGRHFVAAQLQSLEGVRAAGFVFTCQRSAGKWGRATYALRPSEEHRGHRGHPIEIAQNDPDTRTFSVPRLPPVPPMTPMPPPGSAAIGTQPDDWSEEDRRTFFAERAAIAEYDGGLPRREAEKHAMAELIAILPKG